MSERSPREVIERYVELMNARAWDRLGEVLHHDYVEDYPQSGERIQGIPNAIAMREQYPGGEQLGKVERHAVVGADDRWVVTPSWTVVRIMGTSDRYTYVLRTRYPDGSNWFIIALIELADGLISHATAYFAPDFPAPDWRAPFREVLPGAS